MSGKCSTDGASHVQHQTDSLQIHLKFSKTLYNSSQFTMNAYNFFFVLLLSTYKSDSLENKLKMNDFWEILEKELEKIIPIHLKNILRSLSVI